MWMMTMFDLPVVSAKQRQDANKFRNVLMDMGFERVQLSVYVRFLASREQRDTLVTSIQAQLPPGGQVDILFFTDKQFAKVISFTGGSRLRKRKKRPDQYSLF